jgi:SAM-dependent methyltransferase
VDDQSQKTEFDDVAAWTADVLATADEATVLAGACRGSGSPAALAWLAECLELSSSTRLLDVGSGLGGPSAWAARRYGAQSVGAEPMEGAVRGAARLFDDPATVAAADGLPFASATFDAAWTLGVLDTVDEPGRLLDEVHRCLVPGGGFGVLAYVADEPIPDDQRPAGNLFPTPDALVADLEGAGFEVIEQVVASGIPPVPRSWSRRQDAIDDELAERHGDDDRWREAKANEESFAALLRDGRVEAVLLHAVRR